MFNLFRILWNPFVVTAQVAFFLLQREVDFDTEYLSVGMSAKTIEILAYSMREKSTAETVSS